MVEGNQAWMLIHGAISSGCHFWRELETSRSNWWLYDDADQYFE